MQISGPPNGVSQLTFPFVLQLFRYGFFLGSLYPIYWVSKLITHLIVLAVESTFFTQRRVMYYLYGVRVSLLLVPLVQSCIISDMQFESNAKQIYQIFMLLNCCSEWLKRHSIHYQKLYKHWVLFTACKTIFDHPRRQKQILTPKLHCIELSQKQVCRVSDVYQLI